MILAGLALVADGLDRPPQPAPGRARVSDGDSFHLGADRIRLLGLDAPEMNQYCTTADGRDWPCGRQARDRMAALLAAGPAACHAEDVDQYQRLLATCRVGDDDLGAIMVGEGLAIASGRYRAEEAAAREQGLGIWSGDFDAPRQWRDDHPRPQGLGGWLAAWGF